MARNFKKLAGSLLLHTRLTSLVLKHRCPCCGHLPPAKDFLSQLPEHLKRDPRTLRNHLSEIVDTLKQLDQGDIDGRDGNVSFD